MAAAARDGKPTVCGCGRPRDAFGRCFKCFSWLCLCGRETGSALLSQCNECQFRTARVEEWKKWHAREKT